MSRHEALAFCKSRIAEYLSFKGIDTSRAFLCLNPDHQDTRPSMRLDTARNKAHCFSCGADYDALDLMRIDHGLEGAELFAKAYEFFGLHVDGARIFNAVVEYGCELKEITQYCDSFTICLSKGLGTPVGSLLVGDADYIKRANRWRKMTGGGMRQAGILAAAGLYALKNNVARLKDDHDNAAWMAAQLREIGADVMRHDTNMLFVRVGDDHAAALGEFMKARGVLINASPVVRLVMHLDVNREQLADVVKHWQAFLQR